MWWLSFVYMTISYFQFKFETAVQRVRNTFFFSCFLLLQINMRFFSVFFIPIHRSSIRQRQHNNVWRVCAMLAWFSQHFACLLLMSLAEAWRIHTFHDKIHARLIDIKWSKSWNTHYYLLVCRLCDSHKYLAKTGFDTMNTEIFTTNNEPMYRNFE